MQLTSGNYNNWLARFNVVRQRHGLPVLPDVSPSVSAGTIMYGSQMKYLRNNIYDTYNNTTRLRQTLIEIIGDWRKDQYVQWQDTPESTEDTIRKLEGICAVDPCIVNNICTTYSNSGPTNTAICHNGCTTCITVY